MEGIDGSEERARSPTVRKAGNDDKYAELNELRTVIAQLERKLASAELQIENYEDEVRVLRSEIMTSSNGGSVQLLQSIQESHMSAVNLRSELDDLTSLEKKHAQELEDSRKVLGVLELNLDESRSTIIMLEHEVERLTLEKQELQKSAVALIQESMPQSGPERAESAKYGSVDQVLISKLQAQLLSMANGAAGKHNELQNQLQGFESFVEELKYQYEEFLEVTKLEHESFKSLHLQECEHLKTELEEVKMTNFEDKRKMMREHQSLLYAIQGQFDEYRTTVEFLFNLESAKYEDRLSMQQTKYEQEIRFLVQAKDKFYDDMILAKDAKIMSLIEGSDLQSLLHKHELEIEQIHEQNNRNLQELKTQQETEQKLVITHLRRENAGLESKFDKAQGQIKSLESRMKEQLSLIDTKNKFISDSESKHLREGTERQRTIDNQHSRIQLLSQEKEHLRHRIVRMLLEARGEGDNSLGSLVKRLSRDTSSLNTKYQTVLDEYTKSMADISALQRRIKEKDAQISGLQKGIRRRNEEIERVTMTFEKFLMRRTKELENERRHKKRGSSKPCKAAGGHLPELPQRIVSPTEKDIGSLTAPIRVKIAVPSIFSEARQQHEISQQRRSKEFNSGPSELERGFAYLKRFKALSQAFSTGTFQYQPGSSNTRGISDVVDHLEQSPLYKKLSEAEELHLKLKYENPFSHLLNDIEHPKPTLYEPDDDTANTGIDNTVYSPKDEPAEINVVQTSQIPLTER